MSDPDVWRLVVDGATDGVWNMAVDQALLEHAGAGGPVLRLYGWDPPALSLGRWQPADGAHDAAFLRSASIDLVRRPSGGRAVLHEHERTYAIVGRASGAPFRGSVVESYGGIARALVEAMRALGVDARADSRVGRAGPGGDAACFHALSAHEISFHGRKLVGSAQVRRGNGVLQHGSIPLVADEARLARAVGVPPGAGRAIGIEEARGATVTGDDVDAALTAAVCRVLGVRLVRTALTPFERATAERLAREKYAIPSWTLQGIDPAGGDSVSARRRRRIVG